MSFLSFVLYHQLFMIAIAVDRNVPLVEKDTGSCSTKGSILLQNSAARSRVIMTEEVVMPEHIAQLGNQLFGADAGKMLSMAGSFNVTFDNRQIMLHTHKNDWSIPVLKTESLSDSYKVARLASSADTGHGNLIVVDIGANLGMFIIHAFLTNPHLRILALEPMPMTFLYLKWNMYSNGIPEITEEEFHAGKAGVLAMQRAATNNGKSIEVEYSPEGSVLGITAASLSNHTIPHNGNNIRTTVPSLAIPSYLVGEHVDFLKIDCEGCEHEVVPDMQSKGFLENVDMLAGEVHACGPKKSCRYSPEVVNATLAIMQEHPGSGGAVFLNSYS